MRFPLEMAQEIDSFLDRKDLDTCMTQLCLNGATFVFTPVAAVRTTVKITGHRSRIIMTTRQLLTVS
jgi:hypothetical protein